MAQPPAKPLDPPKAQAKIKPPRYSREYKLAAVRLVAEQGYPVKKAAAELGISDRSLRDWIELFSREGEVAAVPASLTLADELQRLRAEVQRLRSEKEILKKAAKFFALEPL